MCGIVGIFGHPEASTLAYLSLYALQHRGQESAGLVTGRAGQSAQVTEQPTELDGYAAQLGGRVAVVEDVEGPALCDVTGG